MAMPADLISDAAAIEAGCRILGIPLDPAWMDAIALNLRVLRQQSTALLEPALPDHVDPAPVFAA